MYSILFARSTPHALKARALALAGVAKVSDKIFWDAEHALQITREDGFKIADGSCFKNDQKSFVIALASCTQDIIDDAAARYAAHYA